MHINKICFIIYYYLPTCFGCFCNCHWGVIQEYKTCAHNCTKCL